MPSTKTLNQSSTISAVENADLLWIWDSSASELNKISRTNLLTTTDDFNTSYARLAGRIGGQTLIGGTAANNDLTLEGTSNATRTTSYVILQPNGGNVGIGTTSPQNLLHVQGNQIIATASGGIRFTGTDGTSNNIELRYEDSTQSLSIYDNSVSAPRVTFLQAGNVGVGTTNPQVLLHVQGDQIIATADGGIRFTGTDGTSNNIELRYEDSTQSLNVRDNDGATNRVTFLQSGNVGIGTSSPSTRLDIDAGAIEFAEMTAPAAGAANTGRLFCRDNGSGKTQLCIIFSTGAIQVIATQP